jgi:hypothetical protein
MRYNIANNAYYFSLLFFFDIKTKNIAKFYYGIIQGKLLLNFEFVVV